MLELSLSTPADHSDFTIAWPWTPYSDYTQPHESFPVEKYQDKSALVQKIANIYERPSKEDGSQRQFTGWQNAIFYSLEPAALRAIAPFPKTVRIVGENAKTFAALVVHGTTDPGSASDASSKSPRHVLSQRAHQGCIVTGARGRACPTRIVPLQLCALDAATLTAVLQASGWYFDGTFRTYLVGRLKSLRRAGDKPWNVLRLSPDVRDLFQSGLVGFKPVCVAARRVGAQTTYLATFTFHVLGRNSIKRDERIAPGDACLDQMLRSTDGPGEETGASAASGGRLDACRSSDGNMIQVPFDTKLQAEMMLGMLALRWVAGCLWFLAGAGGMGPGDAAFESEESDESLGGEGSGAGSDDLA